MSEIDRPELFKYGASWLRADFHLHTKVDKEFKYSGEDNSFVSDYVAGLKQAGIQLGVVTNHNKFNMGELKGLRKKALKEEIFLLPGVELSVNDGSNGIHTLIVFSDQWLENGNDYINQFLNVAFEGKVPEQYENENGRSSLSLIDTIKKLKNYDRDFFIIFAHVEKNGGLWKELEGGRIIELADNTFFKEHTFGFQKVRTHDERSKTQEWLRDWYPAEVEGSDCKSIEEIGRGKKSFIKLGAFSFDAVRFALKDYTSRISCSIPEYKHSYIKSIRFKGGTLSGKELHFSPELNTLIGIRGSGKSSILEVIRYVLEIPFGDKADDTKYKRKLVSFTMGSGGKVEIDSVDRYGQPYIIHRVLKENSSEVFIDNKLQPGVSIRETVVHKPIYFGQKDLAKTGEGFEKDLVEKLLGSRLDDIRLKINNQKILVIESIERLKKVANVKEQLEEHKSTKLDTEHRLKFYEEHGLEKKLQKRLDFDSDIHIMKKGVELTENFISDIHELFARHEDEIRNYTGYVSKHNSTLFEKFYEDYSIVIQFIDKLKKDFIDLEGTKKGLNEKQLELHDIRKGMVEEFAEIERQLAEELKSSGTQNISSEDFLKLKKKLATAKKMFEILSKEGKQKKIFEDELLVELQKLNDLWNQEFHLIKEELDKVGVTNSSLSITSEYKEDKETFIEFMQDIFKGSNIRKPTYQNLVDKYQDFVEIYKDFENAKSFFGTNPQIFIDLFMKNLTTLLTYQTPNKFTILYGGKEIQHHSLGQRASALILFVLSQRENDIIIIDQPEDDLDNQTIYEDVIKLIRKMKPKVQFIFATHNPNIPVLGDAEQVHTCSFMDDSVSVQSGSVDESEIQKTIVNIMEGGKEAFNRRKEIYQIWNP